MQPFIQTWNIKPYVLNDFVRVAVSVLHNMGNNIIGLSLIQIGLWAAIFWRQLIFIYKVINMSNNSGFMKSYTWSIIAID